MDSRSILAKTQKGLDEIQTRANKLPQKRRSVLILVDGRSTMGNFVARFPAFEDIAQTLQELVDEGYVEVRAGTAAAPTAPTPAVIPDQAEFNSEVRALSRTLYDTVGPAADNVTGRLEAARERESFLKAWNSCLLMVEGAVGKRRAEPLNQRAIAIADRFFQP